VAGSEAQKLKILYVTHTSKWTCFRAQAQLKRAATLIPRALQGFECSKAGERLHDHVPALTLGLLVYVYVFWIV
jgi:hypothetical protein